MAEFNPEHVIMNLHDSGARMDAIAWAAQNDAMYRAAYLSTRHFPEAARTEAMLVAMLAGKVTAERNLLETVQNLRPPDYIVPQRDGTEARYQFVAPNNRT